MPTLSAQFTRNRNQTVSQASTSTTTTLHTSAGTRSNDIERIDGELKQIREDLRELTHSINSFGQTIHKQSVTQKYATEMTQKELNDMMNDLISRDDISLIIVGATWCGFCEKQQSSLKNQLTDVHKMIIYVDGDKEDKMGNFCKSKNLSEIEGLPTLYKCGKGGISMIAVGFTPVSTLKSKLK